MHPICRWSRAALISFFLLTRAAVAGAQSGNQPPALLSDLVDVSSDFHSYSNTYFLADRLAEFDPRAGTGVITWQRNHRYPRIAFNTEIAVLRPFSGITFPEVEYAVNPALPFSIQFVSPRTVRIRMRTGLEVKPQGEELMLVGEPPRDGTWRMTPVEGGYRYTGQAGSVTIFEKPFHIEFRDAEGRLLTRTNHESDNHATQVPVLPFSFIRRQSDYSRSVAAVFSLSPGEKLFGCGESFSRLDKRGQKIVLWTHDGQGPEASELYKPVPFFLSNRGYGMFVHTSAPATFDFGASYQGTNALMLGDDQLDLFVFLGEPKEILNEYTSLTGKSPLPPLWSFGLWMSRISYFSEQEVRAIAAKLRETRLPADVIHIDTGWFENDWRCDYRFSATRFSDPAKMIADLKRQGLHISLWQLPYFVPKNRLFPEILDKGLYVKDGKGNLPYEDAVLDFSNPETVRWYQDNLAALLRMGVGAIKVDFGESAPQTGTYASGKSGFYEHNLYPLRYNKAVADVTYRISGEHIIWARSAWAGSQRYPVHWGGDAAAMDIGMAATLRGGLSLGLSGFSFWSHDIGGFAAPTPEELYRRWLPFGMLTSHSRCHGIPPKEPWLIGGPDFLDAFRRADELKYRLMPYVYAQAKDSSERGLPMVRALFVEFPHDPGSWTVEDEYLFGSQILVAPLMEAGTRSRDVYLPPGQWIDYQTGTVYSGGWHAIAAGEIPVVMLVRNGAAIPEIQLAQSTAQMDWSKLELVVFSAANDQAEGWVCLPADNILRRVEARVRDGSYAMVGDPLAGKAALHVSRREVHTGRSAMRPATDPYTWKNVQIVGGGFVDGIIFHPTAKSVRYARTDIGGAYRWNETAGRWEPLLDWLPYEDTNLMGVESIAVDPSDPDRVYLACGMYSHAPDGAILLSADRGKTFQRVNVPIKFGGNENGRGNGERLAVDPNDGRVLFLGTRHAGLWHSTDRGLTWKRVDSFTETREDYPPGPPWDGPSGIVFVVFDPRSGAHGAPSPVIYVGASYMHRDSLFRSTDGGETWKAVPGQPTQYRPNRAKLALDGTLYISYGTNPGPARMEDGGVWKLDTKSGQWTDITPDKPSASKPFGYAAVSVDARNPRAMIASSFGRPGNAGGEDLFRTVDGGKTWKPVFGGGGTFDFSLAPYVSHTPIHWLFDVEIDPFDSEHAMFTTGYGGYETFNLTDVDAGKPTRWRVMSTGIDETVALELLSPPEGAPLLTAIGDYGGFVHWDLDKPAPEGNYDHPHFGNTNGVACAENAPAVIVRVGMASGGHHGNIGYSLDGGRSWQPTATTPQPGSRLGDIAVSADGATWVWTPERSAVSVTRDRGATWTEARGIPRGTRVIADRVNPRKFYALALFDGKLFLSDDGAASFAEQSLTLPDGLPQRGGNRGDNRGGQDRIYATPGQEGDLWLAAFNGLYHSSDIGKTFIRMDGVTELHAFGFGKAAPGAAVPALYMVGIVDGQRGIFRSDDAARTWVRINDDQHQWGLVLHVSGDPKQYGRVYVGTHGRGILYGDPARKAG